MTEEDIKLIIAEVCARLPYGLKFHFYPDKDSRQKEVIATASGYDGDYQCVETKTEGFNVRNIKLYLRPMDSMTYEEMQEAREKFFDGSDHYDIDDIGEIYADTYQPYTTVYTLSFARLSGYIHWLLEHQFDFLGLIEKGLALDLATLDDD